VCVSDTLIAEIKRIIKSSEIMKYRELIEENRQSKADTRTERVTRIGQRRIKMDDKSLKFVWMMIIFLSRFAIIMALRGYYINHSFRQPKLAL